MSYEQKDNSGSLFKNDRKEKDTHPDRTGTAMIDGVSYWVSGWVKQDKNGNPWMSLAFKPKEAKADKPRVMSDADVRANIRARPDVDDEVPF